MKSYDMKVGDKVWVYAQNRAREVTVSEVRRGEVVVFYVGSPRTNITQFRLVLASDWASDCYPTREELVAGREEKAAKAAAKAAKEEAWLRLPADERRRLRGVA
jgi:hypothetical protein